MAYRRLHYHIVWTTWRREAFIDADREAMIHRTVYGKAKELGILVQAIGGVDDHLHVVASIPPQLSIAQCIGQLKGASSHRVNRATPARNLRWQDGYGALPLGERSLATVISYVHNQREHHSTGRAVALYEQTAADTPWNARPVHRPY